MERMVTIACGIAAVLVVIGLVVLSVRPPYSELTAAVAIGAATGASAYAVYRSHHG